MSSAIRQLSTLDYSELTADVLARALDARDPRFDGVFFVGIVTTGIYCRPICPSRLSHNAHRRFFTSAAAAERAGFRPCLRCRPELAPGRAVVDALSRLARLAERRIAAGALNGRSVADLARELGVSDRHLRRALEHELGVSPIELAQTHRLLLAKRLLADTTLSVTQIAYASGFQSLRRFNAAFREAYGLPPSGVRRPPAARRAARPTPASSPSDAPLGLTLAYRAPFAWGALLGLLARDALDGVETVTGRCYGRTVCVDGRRGIVLVEDASAAGPGPRGDASGAGATRTYLRVTISASLVPVLMPLLVRLRQLFDLDAEPTVIDSHLTESGLAELVRRCPGLRIPGAVDGFDVALRALLRSHAWPDVGSPAACDVVRRLAWTLGEPIETGRPDLCRLAPTAARVAEAGADGLMALGVPRCRADAAVALARLVADDRLQLEPGGDPETARAALADATGANDRVVATILMRALGWPDVFPASDPALQRAAGAADAPALHAKAERWRPWRAYAALHLWLDDDVRRAAEAPERPRRGGTTLSVSSRNDEVSVAALSAQACP